MSEERLEKEQEKPRCHHDDSKRLARLRILDAATRVDSISYMDRMPDEILEKILRDALLSSDFSCQNHVCQTYNALLNVNARFNRIASRLAWTLPSIHLGNRGEAGKVSVKKLLRRFGEASGVSIEVERILASRDWQSASLKLRFRGFGWFSVERIFWNKT